MDTTYPGGPPSGRSPTIWSLDMSRLRRLIFRSCQVTAVDGFVVEPQDLLQLLMNHSMYGYWDLVDIDTDHAEYRMLRGLLRHLQRKVMRLHVSTHTRYIHSAIKSWFQHTGWVLSTDFVPLSVAQARGKGKFVCCDGRVSARSPWFPSSDFTAWQELGQTRLG